LTKGAFHHSVATLLKQHNKKRLSVAAMETLAIIAYKQPVSKTELEKNPGSKL
jgi:segregation and condensation protein B